MAPHRIGGLAVALGIGSAVVVGHPVASADSPDGSTKPASTESTSTKTGDDTSKAPAEGDSSTAAEKPSGATDGESDSASNDSGTGSTDADATPKKKKGSKKSRQSAGAAAQVSTPDAEDPSSDADAQRTEPAAKVDVDASAADASPTQAADSPKVTVAAVNAPAEPKSTIATPENPVELATVVLSRAVSALFSPFAGDAPSAPPAGAPAVWTLAAAARRELSAPSVDEAANPLTNSLTADVADTPSVVAIEQTPPLGFLQQLPILGPVAITPIVTAIHFIPVVSDVLHPFVGYPVQFGLPADAPRPRDYKVISSDGTAIYVHFIPARGLLADQDAPTILNGPGLTLPGATNLDGTFLDGVLADATGIMSVGVLRNAGYNVVTWDPRGEWNSGGRLELNAAEFEGQDMAAIISFIADQPEARLDVPGDPRLGMTGVSYGGGIQLVTAANDTRVDAIVPAITYNALDSSLYKGGAFKTSWATPLALALTLTGARINPRILPAAIIGDLTGKLSQADLELLQSRNPDISKITVPTLLIQGTADTIFSTQEADTTAQILLRNGVPVKVLWFCGGHGFCANNPADMRDGQLIQLRTLQWLDKYVKEDPQADDTGATFEWVDQRGQWYSSETYPATPGSSIVASTTDRSLPLIPYIGGSGFPFVPFAFNAPAAINLKVPKATSTTYLVGAPKLSLTYSGTGSSDHVYAQLVDDKTGLVLGYLATPIPVTLDGQSHTIDNISLEPVAHTLRPGESVTLQLVGSAGLYEKLIPSLGTLNVSSMELTLPTAAGVSLEDVDQVIAAG